MCRALVIGQPEVWDESINVITIIQNRCMQPQVTNYVENAVMSWPIHYQPLSRLATQSEPHVAQSGC